MLEASPFWQNAFVVAMVVAVGWCVWSGWRMGVVRAIFMLVGMCVAGIAAVVAGMITGGIVIAIVPVYAPIVALFFGTVVALIIYFLTSFIGGLLFKRTAQQPMGMLRFVYGIGGALVGVFVGVSVFWSGLLLVRGMGGLCEAPVDRNGEVFPLPLPAPVARTLVKLKRSVEVGSTGKALEALDPVPSEYYRVLNKFGRLISDQKAMQRFVRQPGIREVLADLSFTQLTNDPEIQDIARSENPTALIGNQKVLRAIKDPGLIAKLQKIDIEKELDLALAAPASSVKHSPNSP